jgi:hypothetical protein
MARAVPAETHLAGAWKLRIPAALVWGRARPIGTRGFRDLEGAVSECRFERRRERVWELERGGIE